MRKLIYFMFMFLATFLPGCNELDLVFNSLEEESAPAAGFEDLDRGTVVHVVDGDTFDVELDSGETERIRPILVDAPEICHQSSPSDCEPDPYGEEATEFTKDLLLNETVYLEQDVSETDRYDRRLAYVYLEHGEMFQELLLVEGLAKVAVFEPDVRYQRNFEHIEQDAKDKKLNIWAH